jgi:hypothetical protein
MEKTPKEKVTESIRYLNEGSTASVNFINILLLVKWVPYD